MLSWLKWKIAGKEMCALYRYQVACVLNIIYN